MIFFKFMYFEALGIQRSVANSDRLMDTYLQGRTQGGGGYNPPAQPIPPTPLATYQTKIPYPKLLKHSNKTKLRFYESKNNFLIFTYH